MARLMTVLAVLAVLVKGSEATGATPKGRFNKTWVSCDSQGFAPEFRYTTEGEEHEIAIDIDIGGLNKTGCVASMAKMNLTNWLYFTYRDFITSNNTAHIPYMEDDGITVSCGGVFKHWTDTNPNATKTEKIRYQVNVTAIVTRTFRRKIERKTQYPFVLTCLLDRAVSGISTNNSFRVLEQLVDAAEVDTAVDIFTFDASIKFYEDNSYNTSRTGIVYPRNDDELYLEVKQSPGQNLFKFVVNKCYATVGPDTIENDLDANKDVFFDEQCHVDETVHFNSGHQYFRFSILSFSFPNPGPLDTIFFHCDLYVCLADNDTTPCTQKDQDQCINSTMMRRRRSVEGIDYDYQKTISAAQPVLLKGAQIHPPSCGEGFLFDRELEMCSRENILEVRNIRLSQDIWRQEYANTSSLAFKELAKTKGYQLWVLIKTTKQNKIIHGVKVLRARQGSVIIDVSIKYSDSVTAEQAFAIFKQILYTPASTTRVQDILRISHEKIIEYVPVMSSEKSDTEKLILIVVVVVLFVVVFIAGVTLFKVRQVRQRSTTHAASGFDNKGIDA